MLRALSASSHQIHAQLAALGGPPLQLPFTFSDLVPFWKDALPTLSMAMSAHGTGLAVPDWNFVHNSELNASELGMADASWGSAAAALRQLAERHGPPGARPGTIVWRGAKTNEPWHVVQLPDVQRHRRTVALQQMERFDAAGELDKLNLSANVTCPATSRLRHCNSRRSSARLSWTEMCRSRYMLHLAGFGFSYALRYRLACGAIVIRPSALESVAQSLESPMEWWEAVRPLRAGVQLVELDANMTHLIEELTQLEAAGREGARRMQAAALAYVREVLSDDAVLCYWRQLLLKYADIQAAWHKKCQPRAATSGAAPPSGLGPFGKIFAPGDAREQAEHVVENPQHELLGGCYPGKSNPCFRRQPVPRPGTTRPLNVTPIASGQIVPLVYRVKLR